MGPGPVAYLSLAHSTLRQAQPEETLGEHPWGRTHPNPHPPPVLGKLRWLLSPSLFQGFWEIVKESCQLAGLTQSWLSSVVRLSSPHSSWSLWTALLAGTFRGRSPPVLLVCKLLKARHQQRRSTRCLKFTSFFACLIAPRPQAQQGINR